MIIDLAAPALIGDLVALGVLIIVAAVVVLVAFCHV